MRTTPTPTPAGNGGNPQATAQQRQWLDQLIDSGYVFVPDTSALMHSQKQTARRFFERELLPRLLSQPRVDAAGASPSQPPRPSCVWVHRRVRGELMRHARADNDPKRAAKAADGLKAITMLADAGLVIDHDDPQGTFGAVDSYADPALELLLRRHQRQQHLCIVTQDRGLAAKLLAQREPGTTGRTVIVRLCVDGTAAIENWDGVLSSTEREQAVREVSVDARVEVQVLSRAAGAAPLASGRTAGTPPRPSAGRSTTPGRTLPQGSTTRGTLRHWKGEQGYGFVEPDGGGPDIFIHIRALAPGSHAPREGDRLTCVVGRDDKGRPRAERAWSEEQQTHARRSRPATKKRSTPSGRPQLVMLVAVALAGLAWWLLRR